MPDNEKEAEDTTKFEELKEGWVNDEIDTLTYVAVLHNRIETLEGQLAEAKKESLNYKNVLIGQGFENLGSLAKESRDTTQIGVVAKQRTEQIIAQLAEAMAEVEKLKCMTPTDAIAMRTSSVKQARQEAASIVAKWLATRSPVLHEEYLVEFKKELEGVR